MYKILIVEDDRTARNMILESIDWQAEGFVPYVASNGMEALQSLEETPCDVLISDIEMSVMNGLELMKQLKESGQETPVIVCSAHSDFPLVQTALQNNAVDYLLKPITKNQLLDAVRKVKKRLDDELAAYQNYTKMEQEWSKNAALLREQILSNLIFSEKVYHDPNILKTYGLDFSGKAMCVGYLQVATVNSAYSVAPHIQVFSIYQSILSILQREKQGYVFLQSNSITILRVDDDSENFDRNAPVFFLNLQQRIEKYLNLPVCIGIGHAVRSLDQLHEAYQSALVAYNYNALRGKEPVFQATDISSSKMRSTASRINLINDLTNALLICNYLEVDRIIDHLFLHIPQIESIRLSSITIFMSILSVIESSSPQLIDHIPDDKALHQILFNNDITTLKATLTDLCHKVMETLELSQNKKTQNLVQTAFRYVDSHYSDSSLSTESISKALYVSMSHFCAVFKKNTGQTFMNYLTGFRMEKAAQLLLGSSMHIHDVASAVGFPDTNYFSLCFKRIYHQSPREYRRTNSPRQNQVL